MLAVTSKVVRKNGCVLTAQSVLVVVVFVELLDQFRIILPVSFSVFFHGRCDLLDNGPGIPRIPLSKHRLPEAEHPVQSLYAFRRISD